MDFKIIVLTIYLTFLRYAQPKSVLRMSVDEEKESFLTKPDFVPETSDPVVLAFAKHFQNDMVLQRAPRQANIYGFSPDIGTKIVLTVENANTQNSDLYETTVKQGPEPGVGTWSFSLSPQPAGTNVSLRVEGVTGTLTLTGVIYGDVWVCSGQSNMEFTVGMMARAQEELADAHNYPNIRIFAAAEVTSNTPLYDLKQVLESWSKPSKETLGGKPWSYFSAVCWLFGKNIHKELGIPIGLVDTNWGGTPVEAWSSPDALAKCNITETNTKYRQEQLKAMSKRTGLVGGPQDNSVLWNAMVNPLLGMTIYGAIWYQGEADQYHPKEEHYNCTFPTMIDDWRVKFHKTSGGQTSLNFPFGFVQLSSNVPDPSITFGIPNIRWHQTADYGYVPNPRMQNVFMAVAMDLPGYTSPYGTIHPQDKTDVGYRLALSGLQYAYNRTTVCQGPFPTKGSVVGSSVQIVYGNVQKLEIRDWSGFDLLCSPASGADSPIWVPTSLTSNTDTTIDLYLNVCPSGHTVTGVRYAWRESPCSFKKCAIYGASSGLPGPEFVAYANKGVDGSVTFDFSGPEKI